MANVRKRIVILFLLQLFLNQFLVAQPASIPAFPGAEGAGAYASGGRDGDLYFVTNLNDSGPGSFREAIDTTPAIGRTILFKVGGYINLKSSILINKENITIAGQTAPGDGITIRNYTIYIGDRKPRKTGQMLGNNIILRHLHIRLGSTLLTVDRHKNLLICNGNNIIIDHLSSSWSYDTILSATMDVQNLTVQNTIMAEPLNQYGHSFGSRISSGFATEYSWHHNLWAHTYARTPRLGSDPPNLFFRLDFRNNVIYNPFVNIGYSGSKERVDVNYISNYIIAGPSTSSFCVMKSGGDLIIYQSGNLLDTNKDGVPNGSNTGWGMFCGNYDKLSTEVNMPFVTTESAGDAYLRVLSLGGAMPWNRGPVDKYIIDTVINQNGKVLNRLSETIGFPQLNSGTAPVDSDSDGMPDFWELAMGLDPENPADRKNKDPIGYTMLEGYLNWLADGHAVCHRDSSVDIDLRELNGGLTFLKYTVASGSKGTATLLSDGYTIRFTAASGFSGLADFSYSATDPSTGYKLGPVSIGVLITGKRSSQPTPIKPPPTIGICGDVNGDDIADIVDALLMAKYCVGLYLDYFIAANADVNSDGIINVVDALVIAKYYVGIISSLNC